MARLLHMPLSTREGTATAPVRESGHLTGAVVGCLSSGYLLQNPTWTARPENAGLVLTRYGLHLNVQPWSWA